MSSSGKIFKKIFQNPNVRLYGEFIVGTAGMGALFGAVKVRDVDNSLGENQLPPATKMKIQAKAVAYCTAKAVVQFPLHPLSAPIIKLMENENKKTENFKHPFKLSVANYYEDMIQEAVEGQKKLNKR